MGTRRTRYLFITADAGLYGSARSLQLLIGNLGDAEIDLVVAKTPLLGKKVDPDDIRPRFGPAVRVIEGFHFPLDYCYRGKPGPWAVRSLYELLLRLLWLLDRRRFLRFLAAGGYDVIHLNTLVLHRLIAPKLPFILHVREIFDHSSTGVSRSLSRARGAIFVDETTREQFPATGLPPHIVLHNPVDMTTLATLPEPSAGALPSAPRGCTVFSVIGKFTADKGVEFIISCFRKVKNADARLLIVGSGDPANRAACAAAAEGDSRIVFWGEEPDIRRIYRMTDYVVRGEPYFCVGRTMYEGLYAGCRVIVPGRQTDSRSLPEYDAFRDRILFYHPRDAAALTSLLETSSRSKAGPRDFRSNVAAYAQAYRDFVQPLIGRTP